MCGIAGIFRFDNYPVDERTLNAMVSLLEHRGPDDSGIWMNKYIGLGHTRLSILDLSKAGHQPMIEPENNSTISYNGEVYNYIELKDTYLTREAFCSKTDTEVVLKCLVKYGVDVLNKFEGMFAIAFYNYSSGSLLLVCDPAGIKPLYYHVNQNRIIFASEIKPLFLDPQTPRSVNSEALRQHLLFGYALAPLTAFDEVQRLEPGHYLSVTRDGVEKHCYWSPEDIKWNILSSENVRKGLDQAMKLHIRADTPCGSFLSGGLDSSLIVASLSNQGYLHKDFKVFNVGTQIRQKEHEYLKRERDGALAIAKQYNLPMVLVDTPMPKEICLEKIVQTLEEPICDPAAILIDKICQEAHISNIPVLLSGHGGDEIFAGYRRHIWARYFSAINLLFPIIYPFTRNINHHLWTRMIASLNTQLSEPLISISAPGWFLITQLNIAPNLFPPKQLQSVCQPFLELVKPFSTFTPLKRLMILDFRSYLSSQNLVMMDKMSMKHSIEVRLPFLHLPLLDIGWKTPDHQLIRGGKGKLPLRKIAQQILPSSFLKMPKSGFGFPIWDWINSEQGQDLLLSDQTKKRGLFEVKAVRALMNLSHNSQLIAIQLYNLAIIEQWHRTML